MHCRLEIYSNRDDGQNFDVSGLVHDIRHTTSLDGSPGKLTFTMEKDPAGKLSVECGYTVRFYVSYDDAWVNAAKQERTSDMPFQGTIFTLKTDRTGAYDVTAYDTIRYLSNHDSMAVEEGKETLHDVFEDICSKWQVPHNDIVKGAAGNNTLGALYLPKGAFNDMSLFDILSWAMTEAGLGHIGGGKTLLNQTIPGNEKYDAELDKDFTGAYFYLQDKNGQLCLNEVTINEFLKFNNNPVIIGDESLLTDYQYEISIDKETYNEVLLVANGQDNKEPVGAKNDPDAIKRWGLLSKTVIVKDGATKEQIEEYLNLSLQNGCKVTKTLRVEALGFPLLAGDSFVFRLKRLKTDCKCYVMAATHEYNAGMHTMSLEISTNLNMTEVL